MIVSLWRYAHLALAVFSSAFLVLASLTGIILATDAVNEKIPPFRVDDFDRITLAETLKSLKKNYPEVTQLTVDHNDFVILNAIDNDGNNINAYIDPGTGNILGKPKKKSDFIQWTTSLHRSLFLHEIGRIFVGVNAFLLLLIAVSGAILIIQRQGNIKRFFTKISKDSFAQFYHVTIGRLMLVPIIIIALTGTYLTMERFYFFGEQNPVHNIIDPNINVEKPNYTTLYSSLNKIQLSDIENIEFPFIDEPGEYYIIKLKDSEIIINQFTGKIVSKIILSNTTVFASVSLNLHAGYAGMIWAIILGIACLSILFFIYSGFAIMFKRRATVIKNMYKPEESRFILLAGSENGSTLHFANTIHQQLIKCGYTSYLSQADNYTLYPKAEHLIIFTSTLGQGDAPSNAKQLISLINKNPQQQQIKTSVVGFGSKSYPDFCGFAKKINNALKEQIWTEPLTDLYSIDEKSAEEFTAWVSTWSQKTSIPLATTPALYSQKPKNLNTFKVINKIKDNEHTFILTLKPKKRVKFTSGDLLTIYPNEQTERLYSIGKVGNTIQLVIKLHENGLGSSFLDNLCVDDVFKARVIENKSFHLPKYKPVIMIANGTGIAPFLGMLQEKKAKLDKQLYCGFRNETLLTSYYRSTVKNKALSKIHMAFSREKDKMYVMDLIQRDRIYFTEHLDKNGIIMICGSLSMQKDVEKVLDEILIERNKNNLAYYKYNGQILTDCY